MKKFINILLSFILLTACTEERKEKVDVKGIKIDVKIQRLEKELMQFKSKNEVESFLGRNRAFTDNFLKPSQYPQLEPSQYPHDSVLAAQLFGLIQNKGIQTLYKEIEREFGDFKDVTDQFEEAFKHIKFYYPDFKAPLIQTGLTGLSKDLFVSDSLIIIGLDYYIGDKASYVPNFPQYILKRYRKEYIVPSIVLLLSQKYNPNFPDKSLLSDMIYYGKSFEFASQMMPFAHDSLITGYNSEQLTETEENKAVIWAHFVEKKLLFETSHFVKLKYVDERPYTAEIGSKCPGAIGRWLGWEIVKKYRSENQNVSLPELMKNTNAQQLFMESKYKGK